MFLSFHYKISCIEFLTFVTATAPEKKNKLIITFVLEFVQEY